MASDNIEALSSHAALCSCSQLSLLQVGLRKRLRGVVDGNCCDAAVTSCSLIWCSDKPGVGIVDEPNGGATEKRGLPDVSAGAADTGPRVEPKGAVAKNSESTVTQDVEYCDAPFGRASDPLNDSGAVEVDEPNGPVMNGISADAGVAAAATTFCCDPNFAVAKGSSPAVSPELGDTPCRPTEELGLQLLTLQSLSSC